MLLPPLPHRRARCQPACGAGSRPASWPGPLLPCQFADLCVQALQIDARCRSFALVLAEHPSRAFEKLGLPLSDLVGVDVELLRQFGERLLPPHGGQSHLRPHMGRFGSRAEIQSRINQYSSDCFGIQGLSPTARRWSFPLQINLTFGRRARRLHQYPACGGQGLRRTRPFLKAAFKAMAIGAVRPPGSARTDQVLEDLRIC